MCSVEEEDFEDGVSLIPKIESTGIPDGALCKKCLKSEATVLLRGKDFYCQSCFLLAATHKFRATLGKSKIVRPRDRVLVAHSGGISSTVLLHLIRAGMHESVHKRLVFQTVVLYVDEGSLENKTTEERLRLSRQISDQAKDLGFSFHTVSLSQSLSGTDSELHSRISSPDSSFSKEVEQDEENLKKVFHRLPSPTEKLEFLARLRTRLLISSASVLGCNKVFLADDATNVAVNLLSNISLGRGAHLQQDVGFLDNRFRDILILRPMREFTRTELSYYVDFHQLKIVRGKDGVLGQDTEAPKDSIQGLTESFVVELDANFHGTVSTICRTGDKLSSRSLDTRDSQDSCILCKAFLDTEIPKDRPSAASATAFSRLVSTGNRELLESLRENRTLECEEICQSNVRSCENAVDGECNGEGLRIAGKNCCSSNRDPISLEEIEKCLCYSCRLIFRKAKSATEVPEFLRVEANQQLQLLRIREEISDFLL